MDSEKISLPLTHLEQLLLSTQTLCVEVDLSELPHQNPAPSQKSGADHDLTELLGAVDHKRLTGILADSDGLPALRTIPLPLLTPWSP